MHDQDLKDTVCYIGKVGILDDDGNPITVDWRSPISSLYYDSNVGLAEYMAPDGLMKGTLKLKRQFDIQEGELIHYQDVNTVSNDELLKPYLSTNADSRLKNIVATIQGEQNAIIVKVFIKIILFREQREVVKQRLLYIVLLILFIMNKRVLKKINLW